MKRLFLLLFALVLFVGAQAQYIYSNAGGDFTAEVIDATKTIYVSGASFTITQDNVAFGRGKIYNTGTGSFRDLDFRQVQVSGDTLTFTRERNNFTSTDSAVLELIYAIRSASSGGGGGALTGVATYSNVSSDFSVEAITGTTKAYVTGAPFTIQRWNVMNGTCSKIITSTGVVSSVTMTPLLVSGDTITFSGESTNFASGDELSLFLVGPMKTYDESDDMQRTKNTTEPWTHYTDIQHPIDETGLDGDSAYAAMYMASFAHIKYHINVADSGYVWLYESLISGASDTDETSDWIDITSDVHSNDSIIGPSEISFEINHAEPLKYLIKTFSSDDTCAVDVYYRVWY